MNVRLKVGSLLILIAFMLIPLGFYDSVSQAKSKSEQRLDENYIEMVISSEKQIKQNVTKLATLKSGISIFSFQYKTGPTTYVGLMADDLARIQGFAPFVVHMGEGHYAIDYENLGLSPITLETWETEGLAAMQARTNIAAKKQNRDQNKEIE